MQIVFLFLLPVVLAKIVPENVELDKNFPYKPELVENCGLRGGHSYNRIVGGSNAEKNEFPWQVSLQLRSVGTFKPICGGAIVDKEWVLTAAHCMQDLDFDSLKIVAAAHNLNGPRRDELVHDVVRIVENNFDLPTFYNDIALVKVSPPFDFDKVKAVCVPRLQQNFTGLAVISGWGYTSETQEKSAVLQKVSVPIISKNQCFDKYIKMGLSRFLNDCVICTLDEGKDACQGDSGGPLICQGEGDNYYLCGIVSWGIGCARNGHPGMFVKVSCFSDWINYVIKGK